MSNSTRAIWTCVAALGVFVVWIAVAASAQVGVGFFYAIPVGMASWWFGWRGGAVVAVLACLALYVVGAAIHPVSHFGLALAVRAAVFVADAALRAEPLVMRIQQAILDWTDQPVRDDLCLLVLKPEEGRS